MDKPLVSFCVMCYNQERYIEAGLRSALEQTYSPLEIIVSDNCSTDASWAIIQRVVREYDGPHTVILNRNDENVELIGNFEKLCSLSSGELVFVVDGDDISFLNRAECIVADWEATNRRALLFGTSCDLIDEQGVIIGEKIFESVDTWDTRTPKEILDHKNGCCLGATMVVARRLLDSWTPVDFKYALDDNVCEMRALFFDDGQNNLTANFKIRRLSQKTVQYRCGIGHASAFRRGNVTILTRLWESSKQTILDYDKGVWRYRCPEFRMLLLKKRDARECYYSLYNNDSLISRFSAIIRIFMLEGIQFKLLVHLFPYSIYQWLKRVFK